MCDPCPSWFERGLWSDRHGIVEHCPTLAFSRASIDPRDLPRDRPVPERRLADPRPSADLGNWHAIGALLQNERLLCVRTEGPRSENFDAFIVFRSFQPHQASATPLLNDPVYGSQISQRKGCIGKFRSEPAVKALDVLIAKSA